MSPALAATLGRVAETMAAARERWWIITGAAAALHGAEGPVGDVDVLLGEVDAVRLLPQLGLTPSVGDSHPRYRSKLFARWTEPPLPVEFMAGFHLDGVPIAPTTREAVTVPGGTVFVPGRDELIAVLRALGRPKDLTRAAQLRP